MRRIVRPSTSQEEIDEFKQRPFNVTHFLFDKQLAFVQDPHPFKIAVCSRRAGKTVACAAHLVDTAVNNPGVMCLYITLSARNAERIIWKDLKKINDEYKLGGLMKINDLTITFPNQSSIHLCGANNVAEIENFRGVPLKLVYIDECQSFRQYIKALINDVLAPALMDYAGTLNMIGTPGPVPTGFFHECAVKSDVWSKHYWTFWDNPHIAQKSGKSHQQLLDRELLRRGVTIDDPSIQREWFGRWVLDSDSLLVHYSSEVNDYTNLPINTHYEYIMGIDIGHEDADAIAILAWSENDPTTYLVEELITPKQDITALAEQIKTLNSKYKVHKMVMDMGALGKKIGEEIVRRHQIPVEAADKTRKMENIAFLNDALRTGKLKARKESRFVQDSYLMEVDLDRSTPDKIAISKRYHSDIIDAVLYAFKYSPAYAYAPPTASAKYGTEEWNRAKDLEFFEAELEARQAEIEEYKKMWGITD